MAGNVYEWCLDAYDEDFYRISPRENPLSGADTVDWVMTNFTSVKESRVGRGGSWGDNPFFLRAAARGWDNPSFTDDVVGFRCARAQ
jgi:formylglycine-generating enzyme required for sulfatase activity